MATLPFARTQMAGTIRGTAVGILATFVFGVGTARAQGPSSDQCISSNENAQSLRREKKLLAARAQLLQCISQSCPAPVRADCTERLDDLERAIPTVVFTAKVGESDVTDVRVTMDDKPLVERLDGSPVSVDPGEHVFTFTTSGQSTITKRVVIAEGAKSRQEVVVFPAAPSAQPSERASTPNQEPPPPSSTEPPSSVPAGSEGGAQRTIAIVLGGAGLIALGTAAFFAVSASSKWSDAKTECGTGCGPDAPARAKRDDAESAAMAATISTILGGAFVAAAAVVYFTAPSRTTSSRLNIVPSVASNGGGLSVTGGF